MRSAISFWARSPWNPIETLSDRFRVIAMDQRNAGHSTAPIHSGNGWHSYTADHIALMDHLASTARTCSAAASAAPTVSA